jgi:hypothetical protein
MGWTLQSHFRFVTALIEDGTVRGYSPRAGCAALRQSVFVRSYWSLTGVIYSSGFNRFGPQWFERLMK